MAVSEGQRTGGFVSPEIRKILEFAATVICFKGNRKTEGCTCPPCLSRKIIFNANVGIQKQEQMRASGELSKLTSGGEG